MSKIKNIVVFIKIVLSFVLIRSYIYIYIKRKCAIAYRKIYVR